jgi:Protein of unknown function (DUF3618)
MTPGGKSAAPPPSMAELERDIGLSRRRVGATLDALGQRLSPRRLLQKGVSMASRLFGGEGRRDGDGFRFEPLALGLIGAGLFWLLADNVDRRRRRMADGASGPVAANGELPERSEMSDAGAREPVADFIEENPLLAGLAGLALGVVFGALLPPSRRERERIAQAREDLWQRAEALGHRAAAQIRNTARRPGGVHPFSAE